MFPFQNVNYPGARSLYEKYKWVTPKVVLGVQLLAPGRPAVTHPNASCCRIRPAHSRVAKYAMGGMQPAAAAGAQLLTAVPPLPACLPASASGTRASRCAPSRATRCAQLSLMHSVDADNVQAAGSQLCSACLPANSAPGLTPPRCCPLVLPAVWWPGTRHLPGGAGVGLAQVWF